MAKLQHSAARTRHHPPPSEKAAQAQAAAVGPPNEKVAGAKVSQADALPAPKSDADVSLQGGQQEADGAIGTAAHWIEEALSNLRTIIANKGDKQAKIEQKA